MTVVEPHGPWRWFAGTEGTARYCVLVAVLAVVAWVVQHGLLG